VSRPAPKRLTHPGFAQLGPVLLALGLAAASLGCTDSAPRADPVDPAELRKAVSERRTITFKRGPKPGNVSTARPGGQEKPRLPVESSVETKVKTR
jgi:hypothetical protein